MTINFRISLIVLAVALFTVLSVRAETTAGSQSGSVASTENVNAPVFNMPAAPAFTETVVKQRGLPVATPGTAFVNAPSSDTCTEAGNALAIQTGPVGINASKGGGMQVPCDVRARAINGKVTGRSQTYVQMTQCQDARSAEATEDEADYIDSLPLPPGTTVRVLAFRCPDRLRPQWAKDREAGSKRAAAILSGERTESPDPLIANRQREAAGG